MTRKTSKLSLIKALDMAKKLILIMVNILITKLQPPITIKSTAL